MTYGTVLSRDAFPGTSCQATIGVVLRDALANIAQLHLASARRLPSHAIPVQSLAGGGQPSPETGAAGD